MPTIRSILRFILSLSLLPVCYASGRSFIEAVISISKHSGNNDSWAYFLYGFAAYIVFQALFFKPIRTYVFGHELTHAIAGIISGGSVKSFKVRKSGGSVTLTKTNLFVTLAPYFVPIYTLFFVIAYWLLKQVLKTNVHYSYFLFIFGFTAALHLSLTAFAISQGQSDLKRYGEFYSLILIFILNCIILDLILAMFFPVKPLDFVRGAIGHSVSAYVFIHEFTAPLFGRILKGV